MQISDDISFIILFFLTSLLVFVFSISLFRSSKREKQNINPIEEKIRNEQSSIFVRKKSHPNQMIVLSLIFMIVTGIMVLVSLIGIIVRLFFLVHK